MSEPTTTPIEEAAEIAEVLRSICSAQDLLEDETREVETLLREEGFVASGHYRPAERLADGRWSVDPSTLALLLKTFSRK